MARPIASVVIAARNQVSHLEGCIASLRAQKSKIPFEVHLVCANSTDRTYSVARKIVKQQKLKNFFVWKERKPGSPAARNFGARKARGDILLFTDADCRHNPRWVEELSRPLLQISHYPLAAVSGQTENAPERANIWDRYLQNLLAYWERDRQAQFPAFLPWGSTTNFAVQKNVFRALKGFDERWRTVADDMDFSWRLVLSGFMIGYAPKASLKTVGRHTLRGMLRQMEDFAFYHHSLIATYQRELKLPRLSAQTEKLFSQSKKFVSLVRSTTSISQAGYRGIDSLMTLASLKGALEAKVSRARPNPKLAFARKGLRAPTLSLPRGYAHLHDQGWTYWKTPTHVDASGDLVLFNPRHGDRYRMSEESWKIWEIKAERGQSEDAAHYLDQDVNDPAVLKHIDELTIDLHTRRLLP